MAKRTVFQGAPEPLTAKPSTVSFAVEQGAPYHPDEAYQVLSGERPAPEEEQTLQDKANEHEAQRYARESKRSRKRSELLAELEKAKQTSMGKATQPLSDYEAALVAFHHRPEYALERWKKSGKPPCSGQV
ncbi:hypothetical protein AB4455_24780, partial [Vibrio sp. 10N.261.46.E12]